MSAARGGSARRVSPALACWRARAGAVLTSTVLALNAEPLVRVHGAPNGSRAWVRTVSSSSQAASMPAGGAFPGARAAEETPFGIVPT
ncbi:hypothetical protein [Sphingosinicella sp. YJ22]|uniref:hypothetical protein n=1 Tax=Sphingosinicella sp. YJ22 TaxID=1104780 RepID=UPI00140B7094|nr:hypothetical protein [Sphingosinicella sp. YJ22]